MPHNRRMALEFSAAVRRIPTYPAASAYAQSGPLVDARVQRVALPADRRGRRRRERGARRREPLPRPELREPARRALGPLRSPRRADRRRQRLVRHPAGRRRGAARAGRRARPRVAVVLRLSPARSGLGSPRDPRRARRAGSPRSRRDGRRGHGRDAAGDRLQPEQPDQHRGRARTDRALRRAVPSHVCVLLDEAYCEFNLLDDPDASIALLERHPNLVLLRTFSKIYGLCGLRVGYALCGSRELPDARPQIRQPFFCNSAAQAAAVEALAHQDEVARRVERVVLARIEIEDGLRELGIEPAASQANFCWFDARRGPRRGGRRARPRGARRDRARRFRARAQRRAARHLRHARRERRASSRRSRWCWARTPALRNGPGRRRRTTAERCSTNCATSSTASATQAIAGAGCRRSRTNVRAALRGACERVNPHTWRSPRCMHLGMPA